MNTMSHKVVSVHPSPTAGPLTAATTGTETSSIWFTSRRAVAIARPRATAYVLATPMVVITRVLGPLIRFLNGAANWTVRRLGIEPQEELTSVRSLEELELLIRASGEEGTLEPEALTLLTRSIRFAEKDAASALVPRRSVMSMSVDDVVSGWPRRCRRRRRCHASGSRPRCRT